MNPKTYLDPKPSCISDGSIIHEPKRKSGWLWPTIATAVTLVALYTICCGPWPEEGNYAGRAPRIER